jgi:hypothetical protein
MGFDTSFHPVPADLIAERLLPWVMGDGDPIDDLVARAAELTHIRFTANAWGLGALKAKDSPLEAMHHVFGRPFLVTAPDAVGRRAQIDAFLATSPAEAADVARAHLDALDPGLAGRTTAATDGRLPPEDVLRTSLPANLDTCRRAIAAIRSGTATIEAFGGTHAPAQVIGRDLTSVVLEFAAHFQPGWMSRGPTWPSHLLHDHPVRGRFTTCLALVRPVVEAFGDLPWFGPDSIEENYSVGGCLPAEDVQAVLDALPASDDLERVKLEEALQDAVLRGLPFAEATEIYSGMAGTLN